MSGPVTAADAPPDAGCGTPRPPTVELHPSRQSRVGALTVRRALPRRPHRTVGAWCFADHMGPVDVGDGPGAAVGPHPHIGLQTVTWLVEGELLHRDSLGSEQLIRPGQLNLMTAGAGVAHAEESPEDRSDRSDRSDGSARSERSARVHGIQLWVAQPEATRHGPPAFEHHAELPTTSVGTGTATVLVGELAGAISPARRDTDHVGADLALGPGTAELPVSPAHELALVVLEGAVAVDGTAVTPGHLAYLGTGRSALALTAEAPSRALLLGGVPFGEEILMWWNFVARTRAEVEAAATAWRDGDEGRFGPTGSALPRIPVPTPPWTGSTR